jgi:hypothetical protein
MKPAERTLNYAVYPPNYKPGDGFTKCRTLKKARRQACRYGVGAEIYRWIHIRHRPSTRPFCAGGSTCYHHSTLEAV